MKEIITVGFEIPSKKPEDCLRLNSFGSLSHADIVIFAPELYFARYSERTDSYNGKILYSKETSAEILEYSQHWRKEIINFLKQGKTLIVVLSKIDSFYIYTGFLKEKPKNAELHIVDYVMPYSNYSFLPAWGIEMDAASGKKIVCVNPDWSNFHTQFQDYMSFEVYLENKKCLDPIFSTKNKDRLLGANCKMLNGHLICVPKINLNVKGFTEFDTKTGDSYWTEDANKKGRILLNCLSEIDNFLRKDKKKTPLPTWAVSKIFSLRDAEQTRQAIAKNDDEIKKLQGKNKNLKLALEEQEKLKELLFETGKNLENAVIKALNILGYSAENFNNGELELDQVIISPEGYRYIGECEGKDSKDIDISKFRQLLDSLNEDYEREDVEEKAFGLIFGNPQRLIAPSKRTLDFTKKCKNGAKRESIGLIRTTDLFEVAKYLVENNDEDFKLRCREAIHDNLGGIITFPKSVGKGKA